MFLPRGIILEPNYFGNSVHCPHNTIVSFFRLELDTLIRWSKSFRIFEISYSTSWINPLIVIGSRKKTLAFSPL